MKIVCDVLRQPLVVGAFVLSILLVVGAYFGSHWYYGDIELVEMPEVSASPSLLPKKLSSSEVDLSGLQEESEPMSIESKPVVPPAEGESVDDFLAELSDEEVALLTAEVVVEPQRVSPFGFGPYPQVPSDFPHDPVWIEDTDYPEGDEDFGRDFMRAIELMDRVLIKLWTQGRRAFSASMDNGLVYPGFPDTVYVRWDYVEEPDGTMSRYASEITSGPDVPLSVHDTISETGTIPFGIKELSHETDGIDAYTFLNLNQ